ncbi:cell division cycle protein 20 homolog B-like [Polymixia lowei]
MRGHFDTHQISYKRFRRRILQRHSDEGPAASTPITTERQCSPCLEFDAVCQKLALDSPPRGSPKSKSAQDVTKGNLQGAEHNGSSDLQPFAVMNNASVSPQSKAVMKLAAPALLNDYYTNLLDCSCNGMLALALGSSVYLWNSETSSLEGHLQPRPPPTHTLSQPGLPCRRGNVISSLCWSRDGRVLSVGTRQGAIQLWDVELKSKVGYLPSHLSVVGALSWKQHLLSSGSVLGRIHHHDPRAPTPLVGVAVQQGGVCGLEWSPGENRLASGSTDGFLNVWDSDVAGHAGAREPTATMKQPSAVKAMGWCPWQTHLVATGGGWKDGELRIWDTLSGACINSTQTNSQICSLLWAEKQRALVAGHGLPHNHISCWAWKPPSLRQRCQLTGHSHRVLHLALTACGTRIVSAGADHCAHIWLI